MKPDFPSMNPYLENPDLWTEVHFGLISVLARSLNSLITPKYRAAVEKRVYSDVLLVGIPDVAIVQQQGTNTPETAVETLSRPLMVNVPITEEVQERYLEIRDVAAGVVVTVLEVLSPKNKRVGEGSVKYDIKRQKILSSTASLVEIDLLRTGEPKPLSVSPSSHYRVLVSRADRRPTAELYPFNLRDKMPQFALPLRSGDQEPVLDLKSVLEQVYEEAALGLAIDYTQQPVPPVSVDDFAWIKTLPLR
jgi:Protein of unknown function (DUF4058)